MSDEATFQYSGSSIIYVVVFYDGDGKLLGQMSYDDPIPIPSEGESVDLKEYHYALDASSDEFVDVIDGTYVVQERSTTYQYMMPNNSESDGGKAESEEEETSMVAIRELVLSEE